MYQDSELTNLQIKDHKIYINSEDIIHQGIKIESLIITNDGMAISQSSPSISEIIFDSGSVEERYYSDSILSISSANPIISNLKISNYQLENSRKSVIFIDSSSAPNLTDIAISNEM
ncbi:MAG: hypothetical protein EA365_04510 [Gloeocapsa sp. DLM2.Bin57]|nr:MAG: hypothetical protein EA365_04510 [Gloeocapsa sp. DLM2.Bin57]